MEITFFGNTNLKLLCDSNITIGDNVMCGYNCTIKDGDGHDIFDIESGLVINQCKPVIIENDVWLFSNSTLLKGSIIKSGSIIGYGSVVTKSFDEKQYYYCRSARKDSKRNIKWAK